MTLPIKKRRALYARILPTFIRRRIERSPGLIKILDNIGWLLFDKIFRMGTGLLVGAWTARYLGPEQFGLLNYAITFVGLFGAITGLGLSGIMVRDFVLSPISASVTLGTAFVLQIVAGIFTTMLVIVSVVTLKPDDEFARSIVLIISITLLFKATDVIRYWYEARVESRYIVWVENGIFALMAMLRVALILSEASLIAFVWLTVVEALLISLGLLLIFAINGSFFNLSHMSVKRAKALLQESWPLLLSAIAVTLYMRIDIIMLEAMSTSQEVGFYAAATRISEVWYFLPAIIVHSASPSIISCRADNVDLYLIRLRRLYFVLFWMALGVALPVSLFSESIVYIIFGEEYLEAAAVLTIHLWGSVAVFLGMASSQYLIAERLQIISFYRTLIGLIFNLLLNMVLIPEMGGRGAAIATVISYFIATFSLALFKQTRAHSLLLFLAPVLPKQPSS